MWPLPADEVRAALESCKRTAIVEQNYTAQLGTVGVLELDPSRGGTVTTFDLRRLAPLAGLSVSF